MKINWEAALGQGEAEMLVQVPTQVLIFVQISPGIQSRNRD